MTTPHNKKTKKRAQEPSLSSIFNAFAKKAVVDYPQLNDAFLIYNAIEDKWHGQAKDSFDLDEVAYGVQEDAEELMEEGGAFAHKRRGYHFIAFLNASTTRFMTQASAPRADEVISILEHELGHLVAPGAYRYSAGRGYNFRECVADTFTLIRMKQRTGSMAGNFAAMTQNKAAGLVLFGNTHSFSVPAMMAIEHLNNVRDLSKLTPKQTARLAYEVAKEHAFDDTQLAQITKLFAPVHRAEKHGAEAMLKKCAELMLQDHGPQTRLVFTLCAAVLAPFLKNGSRTAKKAIPLKGAADICLKGEYWNKVRAEAAARAEAYAYKAVPTANRVKKSLGR